MLPAYIYNKVYALLLALAIGTTALAAGQQPDSLAIVQQPDSLAARDSLDLQKVSAPVAAEGVAPRPLEKGRGSKARKDGGSASLDSLAAVAIKSLKPKTFKPNPIRSQWLAMVLPGGGQIYNGKYWKLPIIYGGFLGCTYSLTWNGQMLRDYSQAYLDIMDTDPNTKSYEKMLPLGYDISGREDQFKEIFKNKKNFYRRYRDMSILAFALVYVIGIIDAYVDAELSTFDISRDLSLRMTPAVFPTSPSQAAPALSSQGNNYGLALSLDF